MYQNRGPHVSEDHISYKVHNSCRLGKIKSFITEDAKHDDSISVSVTGTKDAKPTGGM